MNKMWVKGKPPALPRPAIVIPNRTRRWFHDWTPGVDLIGKPHWPGRMLAVDLPGDPLALYFHADRVLTGIPEAYGTCEEFPRTWINGYMGISREEYGGARQGGKRLRAITDAVEKIPPCRTIDKKTYRSVEFNRRETSMLVESVNSGETDKTIAFALGITTGTVKVYWTRMRLKLRYLTGKDMNRTQIALWAERSGRFAGAAIIPQSNSEGEAL